MTENELEEWLLTLTAENFHICERKRLLNFRRCGWGIKIPRWAEYGVICHSYKSDEEYDEILQWCKDVFTGRVSIRDETRGTNDLVDYYIEKEEDAFLFRLRWQ